MPSTVHTQDGMDETYGDAQDHREFLMMQMETYPWVRSMTQTHHHQQVGQPDLLYRKPPQQHLRPIHSDPVHQLHRFQHPVQQVRVSFIGPDLRQQSSHMI